MLSSIPESIINQAIEAFQPVIYLDSNSNYFPIDFNEYLSESKLKNEVTGWCTQYLLTPTSLSYLLDNSPQRNNEDYSLFLPLGKQSSVITNRPDHRQINSIPLYTHVLQSKQANEFYIHYTHMYAYNGSSKVAGCFKAGAHYADKEHVTVHVNLDVYNKPRIKRMYFARHNGGCWLYPDEIDFEAGHPVVYSAYHSHASYNTPKSHYRFWCFTRDMCDKGYRWFSSNPIRIYDDPTKNSTDLAWTRFKGNLGDGHVIDFLGCDWWDKPDVAGNYGQNFWFCK